MPAAAGSFPPLTAAVVDGNRVRATKDFTLTVAAGLAITTAGAGAAQAVPARRDVAPNRRRTGCH
jgi:hypothetical protein